MEIGKQNIFKVGNIEKNKILSKILRYFLFNCSTVFYDGYKLFFIYTHFHTFYYTDVSILGHELVSGLYKNNPFAWHVFY